MEKAKLSITKAKSGKYIVNVILDKNKTQPVPNFNPKSAELNGKEVEIERQSGKIMKIISEGKDIFSVSTGANPTSISPCNHTSGIIDPAWAPYNFVPLNEKVVKAEEIPSFDRYYPEGEGKLYTGFIKIDIETKTPLYIRGTLTEDDINRNKESKDKPDFFSPAGNTSIPGSSIRGMVRTLVEIMSWSEMKFVADNKFSYRALADNSLNLRESYQDKLATPFPNVKPKAKAGYIIKQEGRYWIRPAKTLNSFGNTNFFRIKQSLAKKLVPSLKFLQDDDYKMLRQEIYFKPTPNPQNPSSVPKFNSHSRGLQMWYGEVFHDLRTIDSPPSSGEVGWEKGWLICSGGMHNKKMHHIITEMDNSNTASLLPVDSGLVDVYKNDLSKELKESQMSILPEKENGNSGNPVPCFYIENNNQIIGFGHTLFFRLPYNYGINNMVKQNSLSQDNFDIAESIFGNEKDFSGRVFFEDATLKNGQTKENILLPEEKQPRILSTPKPTTFNHYLCQPEAPEPFFKDIREHDFRSLLQNLSQQERDCLQNNFQLQNRRNGNIYRPNNPISDDDKTEIYKIMVKKNAAKHIKEFKKIRDWNSDGCIRGYKQYWHRSGTDWVDPGVQDHSQTDDQHTIIRPIKDGVTFSGKIRFENLSRVELGALLFALALPDDCCHKLGMGKPLGLGSVEITPVLHLSNRETRYTNLAAEWEPSDKQDEKIDDFKKAFQGYVLDKLGENSITDLWDVDRMKELKRMLAFNVGSSPNGRPSDDKTKYMELGEFRQRRVLPKPTKVK